MAQHTHQRPPRQRRYNKRYTLAVALVVWVIETATLTAFISEAKGAVYALAVLVPIGLLIAVVARDHFPPGDEDTDAQ